MWAAAKIDSLNSYRSRFFRPVFRRQKKEPQTQKIAQTIPKNFLNNSRALPNKTRVLRQIAPESSPESSAKSLSQKFFGVPFLSLIFLVFEVFQDARRSNKENLSACWNATLSCPFMASNDANSYLIPISFWSRSGCWPCVRRFFFFFLSSSFYWRASRLGRCNYYYFKIIKNR